MLIVLVCAGGISVTAWTQAPNWRNSDSVFYQAMSLEVDGKSAQAARAEVFSSPLARPAIVQEPSVADPAWRTFQARFFRRRWLVPALAAAVRPAAGQRALADVAIVGYLLFAVALCLMLVSRFDAVVAVAVSVLCLDLGAVRNWLERPMTDSWGLFLSVSAVLAVLLVLRRGRKWLPLWIALMVALSFTRDVALAPLAAVAWLMFRDRDPRLRRSGWLLLVTGVLATAPAYLIFGESLRLTLASVIAGFEPPTPAHATWSYVAAHYPSFAFNTIKSDIKYAVAHPILGLTVVVGLGSLFLIRAPRDRLVLLMRGWVLGFVLIFALDPVDSGFRYELVLIPSAAVGLCLLVERVSPRLIAATARAVPGNRRGAAAVRTRSSG